MKTLAELEEIREKTREDMIPRTGTHTCKRVVVFMGTEGLKNGARETMLAFMDAVNAHHLTDVVIIQRSTAPFGAPVVDIVVPGGEKTTYKYVTTDKVERIVTEHLIGGKPVTEYMA